MTNDAVLSYSKYSNNADVFIVTKHLNEECVPPERFRVIRETSLLNLLFLRLIISGPEQHCYSILTKTMFIKNSPRIYILWIIPFINLPTSPFGASEIRVINLWVSQEFPQCLPVDCSAAVYLLAVPMSLQFKTRLAISQMFCISPYTCQSVFTVCCK